MGYTTEFKGRLKFTCEMSSDMYALLDSILNETHLYFLVEGPLHNIDYKVTKEYDGIEWNGMEKSYDMVEKANLILDLMQREYQQFGFQGSLDAAGEDRFDVWVLSIGQDGRAVRSDCSGGVQNHSTCPNCGFELPEKS